MPATPKDIAIGQYAPDPLTQVYRMLRDFAAADTTLAKLVKGKALPDLTGTDGDPINDNPTAGAFPELILAIQQITPAIGATNTSHGLIATFVWRIGTDRQLLHEQLFPVTFALFQLHARLLREKGPTFAMPKFVQRVKLLNGTLRFGASDGADDRGSKAWTGLIGIEVVMSFEDTDLGTKAFRA